MTRRPRLVSVVAALLAVVGFCLLGYVAYVSRDARVYQQQARARLIVEMHEPAVTRNPRKDGDLIGEISSARIGLRAVVSEGDSDLVLRRAVGHVVDTVAPGEIGNAALAGHRDGLFRPLRHIRVGDVLTVTVRGVVTEYGVEWTRVVAPTDVWVLGPTSGRTLTLITCHPFSFIGAAPNRFIVRARELMTSS